MRATCWAGATRSDTGCVRAAASIGCVRVPYESDNPAADALRISSPCVHERWPTAVSIDLVSAGLARATAAGTCPCQPLHHLCSRGAELHMHGITQHRFRPTGRGTLRMRGSPIATAGTPVRSTQVPLRAFQEQGEHVSDAVDVLSSLNMCLYKILEAVGVSHNIPSNKPCGAAALRVLGARALPLADGPTAHALGLRHRSGGARLPDLLLAHCHKEWLASALHFN